MTAGREAGADLDGHAPAGALPDRPVAVPEHPVRTLAEQLVEGSPVGMVACDRQGVVREMNDAAALLLPGVRMGELVAGAGCPALADPDAAAGGVVELAVAGRALTARPHRLAGGWTAWYVEDVTEQRRRLDSLLAERARSRFLAASGRRLGLSLHPGRTARAAAELAASALADAAVVVLPGHGRSVDWYGCPRGGLVTSGHLRRAELPTAVRDALSGDDGSQMLLPDELGNTPWRALGGVPAAAAAFTLPGNGTPAGALLLLSHGASPEDSPDATVDAALVEQFAQRAGIALAAADLYAQKARTADVLRRSLLQPPPPRVSGMSFGTAYRPAEHGQLVGGDFYDVLAGLPDRPVTFLLGDVCGKGVEAAVTTGQVRQTLDALRRVEPDPLRLLGLLNATMLAGCPAEANPRFATLVLGTATTGPDGGLRLELAGGGHPPPLVVRPGGVTPVPLGGMLVGALEDAEFARCTVDLAPGDACVLYTDGVLDARGGGRQPFGERRLAELLAGCHVMPAPAMAERVVLHTSGWHRTAGPGGEPDDMAVLVVQTDAARAEPAPAGRHLRAMSRP